MKPILRLCVVLLTLPLAGCAGGLRGAPAGGDVATTLPAAKPAPSAANAAGPNSGADGMTFRYQGEGGTVAIAGEFNAWNTSADPLKKQADGSWTITKKLEPGRYAYKFVVDGTNWKPDPNAAESVDDGFGGKNSIVVVGGAAGATAPSAAKPAAPMSSTPSASGAGPGVSADGVTFRYQGDGGSVALAGEFNAWNTSADVLKKQADGAWTITKKLEPGRYAYKFVVDGTNWKPDPNAAESVDDGFGGKNSIVVVGSGGGSSASTGASASATATVAPAAVPVTGKARAPFAADGGMVFTYAGAASSVVLAGDFNEWSTTGEPMTRQADGTWTITRKLTPGTYAYKFLVDGTTWKPDDGNTESRDDGFGGKNSVVTVK